MKSQSALVLLSQLLVVACGDPTHSQSGAGGSSATGGTTGAGGSNATGAAASSGGSNAAGGAASTGGSSATGGAAGANNSGGVAGSSPGALTECTLTAPTRWEAGVHVVKCNVDVASELTVAPGAIVKFGAGFYLNVKPNGKLTAAGTDTQPIIFTSLKDDANGGDTNEDGATPPARNDWGCQGECGAVNVQGPGSVLTHVQLLYGSAGLYVQADSMQVTASTFAHQNSYGVVLDGSFPVEHTQLTQNAFFDNGGYPLRLGKAVFLDASNVFHDPANPETKNKKQCVELATNIDQLTVFGSTEIAFLFSGRHVSAEVLGQAGLTFKAQNSAIYLDAAGTFFNGPSAIFTSYKDDAVGGDCTGDGATPPAPGDWEGLWIDDGSISGYASPVDNVRYAAKSGTMSIH